MKACEMRAEGRSGGHTDPPGESGWREDARSPVGTLGLAQFMPGTAAWIVKLYPADLDDAAPLATRWALRALVTYDLWLWERLTEFRDDGLQSA
jgi:soluble lytic murein transglycosylase-like protein